MIEQKQSSIALKRVPVGLRLSTFMNQRTCLQCGAALQGRSDKKFCDDYCRNIHYHRQTGNGLRQVLNIQKMLRKNRKILEECLQLSEAGKLISKASLEDRGYRFKYHTHTELLREKTPTYCCFDLGYRSVGTKIEIVRVRLPE